MFSFIRRAASALVHKLSQWLPSAAGKSPGTPATYQDVLDMLDVLSKEVRTLKMTSNLDTRLENLDRDLDRKFGKVHRELYEKFTTMEDQLDAFTSVTGALAAGQARAKVDIGSFMPISYRADLRSDRDVWGGYQKPIILGTSEDVAMYLHLTDQQEAKLLAAVLKGDGFLSVLKNVMIGVQRLKASSKTHKAMQQELSAAQYELAMLLRPGIDGPTASEGSLDLILDMKFSMVWSMQVVSSLHAALQSMERAVKKAVEIVQAGADKREPGDADDQGPEQVSSLLTPHHQEEKEEGEKVMRHITLLVDYCTAFLSTDAHTGASTTLIELVRTRPGLFMALAWQMALGESGLWPQQDLEIGLRGVVLADKDKHVIELGQFKSGTVGDAQTLLEQRLRFCHWQLRTAGVEHTLQLYGRLVFVGDGHELLRDEYKLDLQDELASACITSHKTSL